MATPPAGPESAPGGSFPTPDNFSPDMQYDPAQAPNFDPAQQYTPDSPMSDGPQPSPAELALQPGLLPSGEVTPPETDELEANQEDTRPLYVRQIDITQKRLALARKKIERTGENYSGHPDYLEAVADQSATLVHLLLTPEAQDNPGSIPLNRDGYELLAFHFNQGTPPSYKEIVGVRNIITLKDPQNLLTNPNLSKEERINLEGHINDVQEKSRAEHWMLTDEKRAWYSRVLEAPSLKPYTMQEVGKPKTGKIRKAGKAFNDIFISPPRHVDPNYVPPSSTDESRYLSDNEITRVKEEFWYQNPRDEVLPNVHKRVHRENTTAILAAAKTECLARMKVDDRMRGLKDQVHAENAISQDIKQYTTMANRLGALGVRNEVDQHAFENAEKRVRQYNESIAKRKQRESVIAAGVGPISLHSIELAEEASRSGSTKKFGSTS